MKIIKIMYTNDEIENSKIRYQMDKNSGEFFYSITDIIDNLGLSTDPRNYWKVLKNRLKKGHNQLVTNCNQLKMQSSDGKSYLTDVANSNTVLQIIELISPNKVTKFSNFFHHLETKNEDSQSQNFEENDEISTDFSDDGEIQIDMFPKEDCIIVRAMIAGIDPQNIFISTSSHTLTIKSNRIRQFVSGENNENILNENFFLQELFWGKSKRIINLPQEIDINKVEANCSKGLLTIKLSLLDKNQTKIIKVKNI